MPAILYPNQCALDGVSSFATGRRVGPADDFPLLPGLTDESVADSEFHRETVCAAGAVGLLFGVASPLDRAVKLPLSLGPAEMLLEEAAEELTQASGCQSGFPRSLRGERT
jgi:hypothetical protein